VVPGNGAQHVLKLRFAECLNLHVGHVNPFQMYFWEVARTSGPLRSRPFLVLDVAFKFFCYTCQVIYREVLVEKIDKLDIVRAYSAEVITVWFVGSFRAFKSGSAPRYRSAPHYKNRGIFQEDAGGRLLCDGMAFSRHHSKISAIMDAQGVVLHGQYCGKCKTPMPANWGNCNICAGEVMRPTAATRLMLANRIEALKREPSGSCPTETNQPAANDDTLTEVGPQAAISGASTPVEILHRIADREAHLRAILESDDPEQARLLATLLGEVIGLAKAATEARLLRKAA